MCSPKSHYRKQNQQQCLRWLCGSAVRDTYTRDKRAEPKARRTTANRKFHRVSLAFCTVHPISLSFIVNHDVVWCISQTFGQHPIPGTTNAILLKTYVIIIVCTAFCTRVNHKIAYFFWQRTFLDFTDRQIRFELLDARHPLQRLGVNHIIIKGSSLVFIITVVNCNSIIL